VVRRLRRRVPQTVSPAALTRPLAGIVMFFYRATRMGFPASPRRFDISDNIYDKNVKSRLFNQCQCYRPLIQPHYPPRAQPDAEEVEGSAGGGVGTSAGVDEVDLAV